MVCLSREVVADILSKTTSPSDCNFYHGVDGRVSELLETMEGNGKLGVWSRQNWVVVL